MMSLVVCELRGAENIMKCRLVELVPAVAQLGLLRSHLAMLICGAEIGRPHLCYQDLTSVPSLRLTGIPTHCLVAGGVRVDSRISSHVPRSRTKTRHAGRAKGCTLLDRLQSGLVTNDPFLACASWYMQTQCGVSFRLQAKPPELCAVGSFPLLARA